MIVPEPTDTKINLCDSCQNNFATCIPKIMEFGNGIGNDNVIFCSSYVKEEEPKYD